MRTPRRWLRDFVLEIVRDELDDATLRERLEDLDEDISTAERRMDEKVEAAIEHVGNLCQNEMGKIVWGHVQRHEHDELSIMRSDIQNLTAIVNALRKGSTS